MKLASARENFACPDCGGELCWENSTATSACGSSFRVKDNVLVVEEAEGSQADYFRRAWRDSRPTRLSIETRRRLGMFRGVLVGSILEIGAGDAALARSQPDLDIISADLVPDGIADLGERAVAFPLHRFPFKANSFDTVVGFEVIEHLSATERHAAIAGVRRVLRPGGKFLLSVPTWPISILEWLVKAIQHGTWPQENNLDVWDSPHQYRFRKGQLEAELEGFEVMGARCWAKSATAFGLQILNPALRKARLRGVDFNFLDACLPFDHGSNLVILARKSAM